MVYSGHTINKMYYSGYTVSAAFSCGGYKVFGDEGCTKLTYTFCGSEQEEYTVTGNSSVLTSGDTNNQRLHPGTSETKYMKKAIIGDCITEIGNYAFSGETCLDTITLPSGLTKIGMNAFAEVCITGITFPSTLRYIGGSAFGICRSLRTVNIPSGVTYIGYGAFDGCRSLTSITVNATTPPELRPEAFDNTNNCPIYVPSDSVNTYKAASNWSGYASRIQAIQ